jgi:hypothetical protein
MKALSILHYKTCHRLRVFKNKVLWRTFRPKKEALTGVTKLLITRFIIYRPTLRLIPTGWPEGVRVLMLNQWNWSILVQDWGGISDSDQVTLPISNLVCHNVSVRIAIFSYFYNKTNSREHTEMNMICESLSEIPWIKMLVDNKWQQR